MKNSDLPIRWKEHLERWVQKRTNGKRTKLAAGDFSGSKIVQIDFPDGSIARFRYAVVIEAPDIGELGVFTEHCGYHVFPLVDSKVQIQEAYESEPG
jgi:hypothetical protein